MLEKPNACNRKNLYFFILYASTELTKLSKLFYIPTNKEHAVCILPYIIIPIFWGKKSDEGGGEGGKKKNLQFKFEDSESMLKYIKF